MAHGTSSEQCFAIDTHGWMLGNVGADNTMNTRTVLREPPTVRDLLSRTSWEELDRIASRYGVQVGGRRRTLAVERLAPVLERPQQLEAAFGVLSSGARAVLGLLMLLGGGEDERALVVASDRLLAVRPDLNTALGRINIGNELQTLLALGLCFRDRRRFVVPVEVLRTLPCSIAPATPAASPGALGRSYADLRYTLEQLAAAIADLVPPALHGQRTSEERATSYQPTFLPTEALAAISAHCKVTSSDVLLLLSLLEQLGAVAVTRSRWQLQAEWSALRNQPPLVVRQALLEAWLQPRMLNDLARTGEFVWICEPDVQAGSLIGQYEASLRTLVWRWLRWSEAPAIDLHVLADTLWALHSDILLGDDGHGIWIGRTQASRGTMLDERDGPALARALVRQLTQQLATLGLVVTDDKICALTTPDRSTRNAVITDSDRPIRSVDAQTIVVDPYRVDQGTWGLINQAARMLPPQEELLCFRFEAQGMVKLLEQGTTATMVEQALLDAGAQLTPEFRAQLATWAHRAGRTQLHGPLTLIVTSDDTPLEQVFAVLGFVDVEILGPGCALIEAEHAATVVEQLQKRGYWPIVHGH